MPKFPNESGASASLTVPRMLARRWFPRGAEVVPLPSEGFSGSPIFLVRPAADKPHVLKAFSAGTSQERAAWVHRVVQHLRQAGAGHIIPALQKSVDHDTLVVSDDGRFWEMVEYVEGAPVVDPGPSMIASALRALACVHAAAATLHEDQPRESVSHGLLVRVARAIVLQGSPWRELSNTAAPSRWREVLTSRLIAASDTFESCHGAACLAKLTTVTQTNLFCQIVLRDIWSDHVLFDRQDHVKVAGIIDLHAAGFDTPATDVARLLGSWLPVSEPVSLSWWDSALDTYETVRPLGDRERGLVPLLAASGIVLGLDNWFRWTLCDRRVFSNTGRVVARIDQLVASLPAALAVMNEWAHPPV